MLNSIRYENKTVRKYLINVWEPKLCIFRLNPPTREIVRFFDFVVSRSYLAIFIREQFMAMFSNKIEKTSETSASWEPFVVIERARKAISRK